MSKRFYAPGHFIRLVHSGKQYFETLCHLIDEAQETLHLQVYIFDADETGDLVLSHLQKAAARGVKVFFIADGYGSADLKGNFRLKMKKSGISFKLFSPVSLFKTINSGRRLHQKVCVCDQQKALVGGINISDKYKGTDDQKAWLDYALYIEGPVCSELYLMCKNVWQKKFTQEKKIKKYNHLRSGGAMARMAQNDWLRGKNQISASYKKKLSTANESIVIIASYFLPSRRLLKILLHAGLRGCSISIILSKNSDVPFIKPAIAYLYDKLLKSGIRIFEYNEAVLHAKAVVVDRRWVSIGSHNLNHLSEFISMEINIEVLDKHFGENFDAELKLLMQHHCEEITYASYTNKNSLVKRFTQWFAYKLVSISERIIDMFTRRID